MKAGTRPDPQLQSHDGLPSRCAHAGDKVGEVIAQSRGCPIDDVFPCNRLGGLACRTLLSALVADRGGRVSRHETHCCLLCDQFESAAPDPSMPRWEPTEDSFAQGDRCLVTVAIGREAREILAVTGPSLRAYAARCNAQFLCLTNRTQPWWGLEKFRIRRLARQFAQTLFLDCDVIVRDTAPDIFEIAADLAIFDEYDWIPNPDWVHRSRLAVFASQEPTPVPYDWNYETALRDARIAERLTPRNSSYNSGVVLCTKRAADVWQPPWHPIPWSYCSEQLHVQLSADRLVEQGCSLQLLDRRWNCEQWMRDFDTAAPEAYVVHASGLNAHEKARFLKRFA